MAFHETATQAGHETAPPPQTEHPGPPPGIELPPPPLYPVELGWVRLWSPDTDLLVSLGNTSPVVSQGVGGWEEIERARRKSLTTWKGSAALRITVALLFDANDSGASVEKDIIALETLAGLPGKHEPPKLRFDSEGVIPYDARSYPNMLWVIDAYDPNGDSIIRNADGARVRQECSITLLEYTADERLKELPAQKRQATAKKGKCKGSKTKRYKVKKGDTLQKIAKKFYGDANCWKAIASANKLRDPRKIKVGHSLRLP